MKVLAPPNALITTLEKALDEIDEKWRDYEGLIITGSWPGEDNKDFVLNGIEEAKRARDNNTPYLGICLGLQIISLMERHQLDKLDELRVGIRGVNSWWGHSYESFWHKYGVRSFDPTVYDVYGGRYVDIVRLKDHPFFVGVQFHPEYQSSKDKPHPVLKEFIEICKTAKYKK